MAKRSNEPFLWLLFSVGGALAALLVPVLLFLYGLAFPLGWLEPPSYQSMLALLSHPLMRLVILAFCFLALCHWAHRFRYTLYDGLQIKHLNEVIFVFCYGGALVGTALAGYFLWTIRWE
jgi:fumarate reductase subunit D